MRCLLLGMCFIASQLFGVDQSIKIGPLHNYIRGSLDDSPAVKGWQTGLAAEYRVQRARLFGEVNYEGYWSTVNAVAKNGTMSRLDEQLVELRVGYIWECFCRFVIEPYVGVGYDYFKNEQQPYEVPVEWRYKKLFIPVGLLVKYAICSNISLGARFEWRPDVCSKVKVESVASRLELSNGYRVEIPVAFAFGSCCRYLIEVVPFTDWNRWGRSKEDSSEGVLFPLPAQQRWDVGLKVLFGLKF